MTFQASLLSQSKKKWCSSSGTIVHNGHSRGRCTIRFFNRTRVGRQSLQILERSWFQTYMKKLEFDITAYYKNHMLSQIKMFSFVKLTINHI
jgi:hypothetical protein